MKKQKISDKEKIRIKETINMIPSDVKSILNLGCGDGRVTNEISNSFQIIGLDIDKKEIKSFIGPKVIGNIAFLPFKNCQFDLVLVTEVLEHLPKWIFLQSLKEICRVTKKYILITVPFEESLAAQWVKCSKCGHVFHAWGHLRKFSLKNLERLLPHAYLLRKNFLSPQGTKLPNWLYIIAQKFGNAWNYNPLDNPRCPKCGALPLKTKGNVLGWFLIRIIWRLQKNWPLKKPIWIAALFCKNK